MSVDIVRNIRYNLLEKELYSLCVMGDGLYDDLQRKGRGMGNID